MSLADRGRGGVVLSGGPGVGKTRLAREAFNHLASAGRATEWVPATLTASMIPFAAVSHLLPPHGPLGVEPLTVLGRIADRFAGMAGDPGGPVVVVDDAHLLDSASATLVHQLASGSHAFVLATVRNGVRSPDAVSSLWKDGRLQRIELPPLPDTAIETLLDLEFRGQLDTLSRRRLCRVSAGNPLLLRETLQAGLDTGTLRRRVGIWQWADGLRPTPRLIEIVDAHLGPRREPVTGVLEMIACGEPLPLAVLERLVGAEAIIEAERSGLMTVESSGARLFSRLSHPLYGEVLRTTMPRTRSSAITRQIAKVVSVMPARRRDDALGTATWQLRAGRPGDPDTLLAAAKQALDRFDLTFAERLARAARDAGGGWRADDLLARILSIHGRYEESVRALPGAGNASPASGAIVRADMLYWGSGDVAEAERALTDAAPTTGQAADGNRCLILLFDSRCAEALRVGEAVLNSQDAEPRATVWAAAGVAAAAGVLGQPGRADAAYRHGTAVAAERRQDMPWGGLQVSAGHCIGLLAGGRLDEAWSLVDGGRRAAASNDAVAVAGAVAGFRGVVAKARGQLDVATAALRESLLLLAGFDTFRITGLGLAELAGARALAGDHGQAVRLLARASVPDRQASRLLMPWIELDRAWTLAAGSDVSAAAAHCRHAAELAHSLGQPTVEAWALYDAARLGDARAVHGRLVRLAGELRTPAGSTFAEASTALAMADADQLARAGATFSDLGLTLHAAEAMTVAATLYVRRGQPAAASTAALRAKALTERCPDARTPLLDAEPATSLTRREKEVAQLAARGKTSRQIAARLRLSIRTVDNYLGRVYTKLGVSGRAELIGKGLA